MVEVVTHDHVWVRIEIYTAKICSESVSDNQVLCYSILFTVSAYQSMYSYHHSQLRTSALTTLTVSVIGIMSSCLSYIVSL